MSRWTPTETLWPQTWSHDWHLQLHVAVSCLLSEEKDRYRFITKTWKHTNLRRNDLVLLVLTTTDLFLDTNVPLKKTFGARIKKLAFICFWKTRLRSDLSVSVARCTSRGRGDGGQNRLPSSSICLMWLDIFYKTCSSLLVATEPGFYRETRIFSS